MSSWVCRSWLCRSGFVVFGLKPWFLALSFPVLSFLGLSFLTMPFLEEKFNFLLCRTWESGLIPGSVVYKFSKTQILALSFLALTHTKSLKSVPGYVEFRVSQFSFLTMYSWLCRVGNLIMIPGYVFGSWLCRVKNLKFCFPGYVPDLSSKIIHFSFLAMPNFRLLAMSFLAMYGHTPNVFKNWQFTWNVRHETYTTIS
jgi:hypothetical protein